MSCEYAWRDANELRTDASHYLHYISQLLDGSCTLREHRELLVLAGWLMLLTGCVDYDTGRHRQAELNRMGAFRIGRETGHGEIVAWTFEMSAWFALTQGHLRSVAQYSEAGIKAAPHTSVVVQLAAQSAKAAARMGQRDEASKILDDGYRALGQHERPSRPENHFVIDPQKWDFYAMDCYRLVGEDKRAADHAQEVLRISRRPDGSDKSPMRATEARLTLAVAALRQGDLEAAAEWTRKALAAPRKSVDQLAMVADELKRELRRLFPNDPATRAVVELIGQAYAGVKG
jgi:tetratricopeptide (TPR) repeat protein